MASGGLRIDKKCHAEQRHSAGVQLRKKLGAPLGLYCEFKTKCTLLRLDLSDRFQYVCRMKFVILAKETAGSNMGMVAVCIQKFIPQNF